MAKQETLFSYPSLCGWNQKVFTASSTREHDNRATFDCLKFCHNSLFSSRYGLKLSKFPNSLPNRLYRVTRFFQPETFLRYFGRSNLPDRYLKAIQTFCENSVLHPGSKDCNWGRLNIAIAHRHTHTHTPMHRTMIFSFFQKFSVMDFLKKMLKWVSFEDFSKT